MNPEQREKILCGRIGVLVEGIFRQQGKNDLSDNPRQLSPRPGNSKKEKLPEGGGGKKKKKSEWY